jgi:flagellar M-ring protein FliF
VLLRLRAGARMDPQNIAAITHLVSSAVDGLAPEAVSVMDMQGNLLNRARKPLAADAGGASDAMIEYRQQIERDLLRKIDATLEPLLGPDRYRAAVSVECDFTSGEQSEEILDPTKSVMLTSQRTEDSSASLGSAGVPGTASSLPRPAPRTAGIGGGLSRKTENVTYQSSRTVRRTRIPQGSVKRISVSLLLDQEVRWEKQDKAVRRILEPPSPEKVKAIRELVAGMVNLQPDRGDQVVVETLAFDATLRSEPPPSAAPPPAAAPAGQWQIPAEYQRVVIIGAGAALALAILLGFAFRKLRRRKQASRVETAQQIEAAARKAIEADEQMKAQIADHQAQQALAEADIMNRLKIPVPKTEKAEVLSKHLRELVTKEPAIPVEVLRRWISDR